MPWSSIVIVLNISDKSGKLLCKLGKWPCKDPKTENPNVVGEIPENGETSKTKDDVQLVQLLRKLHLHVTITTIAVAIIININITSYPTRWSFSFISSGKRNIVQLCTSSSSTSPPPSSSHHLLCTTRQTVSSAPPRHHPCFFRLLLWFCPLRQLDTEGASDSWGRKKRTGVFWKLALRQTEQKTKTGVFRNFGKLDLRQVASPHTVVNKVRGKRKLRNF